jgi:hypothetical protein
VDIDVEFQGMWPLNAVAQKNLRPKVIRLLTATRAFVEADLSTNIPHGHLHVLIANTTSDVTRTKHILAAALNGFTYGLVSLHAVEEFEMTVTYRPHASAESTSWKYHEAVHTIMGVKAFCDDHDHIPLSELDDRIAECMLIQFMHDFQSSPERATTLPADAPDTEVLPAPSS